MPFDLPPIVKSVESLQLAIEQAVRAFSRVDRHSIGTRLREQAMDLARLCNRAWRDRPRQLEWTDRLVWAIDEIKITLQLGKQLHAFRSFNEFDGLIRKAEDLGRQAGGWKRQQQEEHPKRQNATRQQPASQRAQTLSTRAASGQPGANP